jgi:6-phosphogluconolactonase (cycloisomerase 2 family)
MAALLAGPADAPPRRGLRQLARPGCLSSAARTACSPGRALAGASWVTVSPDGRNVYVGAAGSGAVAVFARDARTGVLRQPRGRAGCVSRGGIGGCAAGRALSVARPIVVTRDGHNVYVGTAEGVASFSRDPRTGAIRQLRGASGCVTEVSVRHCRRGRGLSTVRALAVTRDGKFVYSAARASDAVAVFARGAGSGHLHQLPGARGCISWRPRKGCARGRGLDGPRGVVLSPDERFAYVAAEDGDQVGVFARNRRSGHLRQLSGRAGCLQRTGSEGCARLTTLRAPHHLVISPDGRFAYVASDTIGAVVMLRRTRRTGRLTPVRGRGGCVSTPIRTACRPARALTNAHSLAFSPSGATLYVAGRGDYAVATLERDPTTGGLAQAGGADGCVGRTIVLSCAYARGLRGVHSVAASPDGLDVYAASELDDAVVALGTRRRRRP